MDNTHDSLNSLLLSRVIAVMGMTLCLFLGFASAPAGAFDHLHKLFSAELRKYVSDEGVFYSSWQKHQEGLDHYIESLCALSEEEYKNFDVQQKESFWLNAYNAMAVKLILNHYPIKAITTDFPQNSIRQIPDTWNAISYRIAGRDVTLYTIAHDILRRDRDCRTHFAVAPATRGGGALQTEAYQSRTVEQELNEITREFLSRPENLSCDFDKNTITVSQIFKWFPLDFLCCTGEGKIPMPPPNDDDVVQDYITQFLPREIRSKLKGRNMKVVYAPYDWSLNEAPPDKKHLKD